VQSILDVPKVLLECKCTASLTLTGGVTTRAVCALKSPVCIVSDKFCGKTEFEATYRYGLRTGLQAGEACLKITSGLGIPAWSDFVDFPELCITGTRNRGLGGFQTCNVTFAGEACSTCSVCPSGVGATFDCSNVNATSTDGTLDAPGPNVEECIGFGLIPDLRLGPNSILPFGFIADSGS
jgi:hypothetical protein